MPFSLIRFNLIDPTLDSQSLSDRYKAMLDMAEFADQNGFFMATFEEHHGADMLEPDTIKNAGTVLAQRIWRHQYQRYFCPYMIRSESQKTLQSLTS